jgi:hypothetical protein
VYGYSVIIPKDLTAYGNQPPFPNHGVGVVLSQNPDSYLYIDGSYNAFEWQSLDEAIDVNSEFLRKNYPNAQELERKSVRLNKLPALRSRAKYVRQGENRIKETVIAFRKAEGDQLEIVYTISLDTTEERFAADAAKVDAIINSWKLIKGD